MNNSNYKIALKALLIDKKDNLFYYQINGEDCWKQKFIIQKENYVKINDLGVLIYSVPWYYGKECDICENSFSKKLFFNIIEHETSASMCRGQNPDYWSLLAKETGDNNWLTKSNNK